MGLDRPDPTGLDRLKRPAAALCGRLLGSLRLHRPDRARRTHLARGWRMMVSTTEQSLLKPLLTWRLFETSEALAQTLSVEVAQTLASAQAFRGRASLAVSGGRTPIAFFEALSRQALDWRSIDVVL